MKLIARIAPDVGWLPISFANVYFIGRPGEPWALIDAGLPGRASQIFEAAEARFGSGTRPEAILLTHALLDPRQKMSPWEGSRADIHKRLSFQWKFHR